MMLIKNARKIIVIILFVTAAVYAIILFYIYNSQSEFTYFPSAQEFENCNELSDSEKITHEGTRIYYTSNINTNTLVIFYHGNGGSACDREFIAKFLKDQGVASIIVEYSGYSNDKQTPSETLIFKNVQHVIAYTNSLPHNRTVVMSESIGSGPATYHTTLTKTDSLILLAPFTTLPDVAAYRYPMFPVKLLAREKYDNVEHLRKYQDKLTIIHGTQDTVIPFSIGQRLYNEAGTQDKKFIPVEGARHNNMYTYQEVLNAIREAL